MLKGTNTKNGMWLSSELYFEFAITINTKWTHTLYEETFSTSKHYTLIT